MAERLAPGPVGTTDTRAATAGELEGLGYTEDPTNPDVVVKNGVRVIKDLVRVELPDDNRATEL